jgi:hypothetical protein
MRFLALIVSALALSACSGAPLPNVEAPARELFECTVQAFRPIAGNVPRAVEIVRDIQSGHVDVQAVLDEANATRAASEKLYADLSACARDAKAGLEDSAE